MTIQNHRKATIQSATMIVMACLSFITGGILFCLSIGAGIANEGYAVARADGSRIDQTWLIASLVFASISIFLFWIGLYRLANVTDDTRKTTTAATEQPAN